MVQTYIYMSYYVHVQKCHVLALPHLHPNKSSYLVTSPLSFEWTLQ